MVKRFPFDENFHSHANVIFFTTFPCISLHGINCFQGFFFLPKIEIQQRSSEFVVEIRNKNETIFQMDNNCKKKGRGSVWQQTGVDFVTRTPARTMSRAQYGPSKIRTIAIFGFFFFIVTDPIYDSKCMCMCMYQRLGRKILVKICDLLFTCVWKCYYWNVLFWSWAFSYTQGFLSFSPCENKFKPVCQKAVQCWDPVLHVKPTFHVKPTSHVKTHVRPTHRAGVWRQIPLSKKLFFVMQRKSQLSEGILGRKERTEIIR